MNREINLVNRKSKKRNRTVKKRNKSPINLGMVVISPKKNQSISKNQNSYKLKIKNKNKKKENIKLTSKSPVHNLIIRSPVKNTQNSIEKYVKITKRVENKSYNRFKKPKKKINMYNRSSNENITKYNKINFKFCKDMYSKDLENYFNFAVLENIKDKLLHYKNLPIEDQYICGIISSNIQLSNN